MQSAKERVQNDIEAGNPVLEGMASMATLLSNDLPSTLKKVLGHKNMKHPMLQRKPSSTIVTKVVEVRPITVTLRSDEVVTTVDNLKEDKARNQRFSTEMGAIAGPKVCKAIFFTFKMGVTHCILYQW